VRGEYCISVTYYVVTFEFLLPTYPTRIFFSSSSSSSPAFLNRLLFLLLILLLLLFSSFFFYNRLKEAVSLLPKKNGLLGDWSVLGFKMADSGPDANSFEHT
jgi:hypothetical protein